MSNSAVLDLAPVDRSLADLHSGSPFWPAPLVAALEDRRPGLSIRFAVRWLRTLLAEIDPVRLAELDDLFDDLGRLSSVEVANPDVVLQTAQEVWYRPPGRDTWQTALARLYEALACRLKGEPKAYMKQVMAAIEIASETVPSMQTQIESLRQLYLDCWQRPEG